MHFERLNLLKENLIISIKLSHLNIIEYNCSTNCSLHLMLLFYNPDIFRFIVQLYLQLYPIPIIQHLS